MTQQVQAIEETFRELARIVSVDDVQPHPNADKMSLGIVGGWQCCIKLDEFKKGDLALYVEIDSLVPLTHPTFAFLSDRRESVKQVGDDFYSRIRTIKLRKELSQGILLQVPKELAGKVKVGDNVTKALGVIKYEAVKAKAKTGISDNSWLGKVVNFIAGDTPNPLKEWPADLVKSDQQRIQNMGGRYPGMLEEDDTYERTIKLDGQSVTMFANRDRRGVCSRNYELTMNNEVWPFEVQLRQWLAAIIVANRRLFKKRQWQWIPKTPEMSIKGWIKELWDKNRLIAIPDWRKGFEVKEDRVVKYALESGDFQKVIDFAKASNAGWAFQGELVGPGIQDNYEGLDKIQFFVYKVTCVYQGGEYEAGDLLPARAEEITKIAGLTYIPVLERGAKLKPTIKELLKSVEGKKHFAKTGEREGEVYKSETKKFSFKVVSNNYLLAHAKAEDKAAETEAQTQDEPA